MNHQMTELDIVYLISLTFHLGHLVVDADTQIRAMLHLKGDPGSCDCPAKLISATKGKHVSGQLVHEVSSLFAFDVPLALHILLPHSQSLSG